MGRPVAPSCGIILAVALEAALVPIAFVAVTVQVYDVPLVRPLTAMGESTLAPLKLAAPSVQVAVYPVTAEPPSSATVT